MTDKACRICKIEKSAHDFFVRSESGHLRSECKACLLEIQRKRKRENPERVRAIAKAANKKWYDRIITERRDEIRRKNREYKKKNPEMCRASYRKWLASNPDVAAAATKRWRENNPDKLKEYGVYDSEKAKLKYYKDLAKSRARARNLQLSRRMAMPRWLTDIHKAQIQEFYDIALAISTQTGVKHQVDHIVPINGDSVCGLHVPWNLQVLSARANISKGNKLIVDIAA